MNSNKIRETFLDFFKSKGHHIVDSAPMVIKNDPTLMFTNAGMNQFKDIFLGNSPVQYPRVADTQKCLRVSGKHNDLDEVGHDTYHHTMFEMLGNWSFGDYFKKEAIQWAWELLVETYKMPKDRIYVTVFEGSKEDNVPFDSEAYELWNSFLDKSHIINGNKKDNFWEMGETGPCGPCSEVHFDLRDDEERKKIDGASLVNKDNPLVIEIWNLVFMQFNRKANGSLEPLPNKHVDTGMGFERLCMVLQGKKSNYDTDVFQILIEKLSELSNKQYGEDRMCDIAMRVISDHLRAIAFSIADGQIPSNVKAGYVIRRILRRAVRYGYTYLGFREPFICKMVPTLVSQMGGQFSELKTQQQLILKVIEEEENSFLRTLSTGINLLDNIISKTREENKNCINGQDAFLLYDTYGFPVDLTELIARENDMLVDLDAFNNELQKQKERSRNAAATETDDWVEIVNIQESIFVGYDSLECDVRIARYRKVSAKGKSYYQVVFDQTPFYGNSGGQTGDKGIIFNNNETVTITDTRKENNLTIHILDALPKDISAEFIAKIDSDSRRATTGNHSATHLLQKALRDILGTHVEQKGSYVTDDMLRFDFSHFQKVDAATIAEVERRVNNEIRLNHPLEENRNCSIEKAKEMGAMMLFGEKYGEKVRTVKFGDSFELCGGTHVNRTGDIGFFKIISEGAISAGVRRIEAITGAKAVDYVLDLQHVLTDIQSMFNSPKVIPAITRLLEENNDLNKRVDEFQRQSYIETKNKIKKNLQQEGDYVWYINELPLNVNDIKEIATLLRNEITNIIYIVSTQVGEKPSLVIMLGADVVNMGLNASTIIKEVSKHIDGGGGGQPFLASAGGKNPEGLGLAVSQAIEHIKSKLGA